MKTLHIYILLLTVLIVGFSLLCKNNNLELFIDQRWSESDGLPILNKSWCKYNNKTHSSNYKMNAIDLVEVHGNKNNIKEKCRPGNMDECLDIIHEHHPNITSLQVIKNHESSDRFRCCNPKEIKECMKSRGNIPNCKCKLPTRRCGGTDCCYLDNENYRIKYGTFKNISLRSSDSNDIDTYRKECLKQNDSCGKYPRLNQLNSPHCGGIVNVN